MLMISKVVGKQFKDHIYNTAYLNRFVDVLLPYLPNQSVGNQNHLNWKRLTGMGLHHFPAVPASARLGRNPHD